MNTHGIHTGKDLSQTEVFFFLNAELSTIGRVTSSRSYTAIDVVRFTARIIVGLSTTEWVASSVVTALATPNSLTEGDALQQACSTFCVGKMSLGAGNTKFRQQNEEEINMHIAQLHV